MRKVWLQQTRIGLSLYDYTGQGFLRESVRDNIFQFHERKKTNTKLITSGSRVLHFRINSNVATIRRT